MADYLAKVGLSLPFGTHTFDSPFGEGHSMLGRDLDPSSPSPIGSFNP